MLKKLQTPLPHLPLDALDQKTWYMHPFDQPLRPQLPDNVQNYSTNQAPTPIPTPAPISATISTPIQGPTSAPIPIPPPITNPTSAPIPIPIPTPISNYYPNQNYPNQNYPNRNYYPAQNYPIQNYPIQNYPVQNYPVQNYPVQNYPTQNYPTQNYPVQNYQAQNYPAQNYPSQNYRNYSNQNYYPNQNYSNYYYQTQNYVPNQNLPMAKSVPSMSTELEYRLQVLSQYDIKIILDDSSSMNCGGFKSEITRWNESLEAIDSILKLATIFDTNGVEVYMLNNSEEHSFKKGDMWMETLHKISPRGGTLLGRKVNDIFASYIRILDQKPKPINLIVISDGEADDKNLLINSIVNFCKTLQSRGLDPTNCFGIQFYQVGTDESATKFLCELDNDLKSKYNIPDIVDHVKSDKKSVKELMMKTMLGGISREIDEITY